MQSWLSCPSIARGLAIRPWKSSNPSVSKPPSWLLRGLGRFGTKTRLNRTMYRVTLCGMWTPTKRCYNSLWFVLWMMLIRYMRILAIMVALGPYNCMDFIWKLISTVSPSSRATSKVWFFVLWFDYLPHWSQPHWWLSVNEKLELPSTPWAPKQVIILTFLSRHIM